jgi:uncharacterized protein
MKKLSLCFTAALLALSFTPVQADEPYILDQAGVLSESEKTALEEQCQLLADTYQIGVYVVFTETMNGYDDYDYAEWTYYNNDLGWGDAASGVLLAVATEDRYYDTFSYGPAGDVFSTSVLDELGNLVLDNFRSDDWQGGAETFITACSMILEEGDYHYYEPTYTDPIIAGPGSQLSVEEQRAQVLETLKNCLPIIAAASLAAALLINFLRRGRMSNVRTNKEAAGYAAGGLDLEQSNDYFINITRHVVHVDRDSSSSSGGGGGGGGHSYHSSGGVHSSGGHHF